MEGKFLILIDCLAAIAVLIVLACVIVVTKQYEKRLSAEASRKIIHITMGCVALSFPFIFTYSLTVICLGVVAFSALLLLRLNKKLRTGLGSSLLGIKRTSYGELFFIISIVIIFILHQSTYEYLIPILILTFADSTAAIIGTNYGRNYLAHTKEIPKSSEGSIMFFIVAFICTLTPLQLMTEIGRAEVLAISFLIGFLASLIEMVSNYGNDNLLLPLLIYSFLRYNIELPIELLLTHFGYMIIIAATILLVYKITNISKLSTVYCLIVGYFIMIQGGFIWILPPMILFLTFGIFPMMKNEERQMIQPYKMIESNVIVGIICLWLSVIFPRYEDILYLSYSLSFACHLAINTYSRLVNFANVKIPLAVVYGLTKAILFIALPSFAISKYNALYFLIYLAFLGVVMPGAIKLNKKFDYKNVGNETFHANKVLVGTQTVFYTIILLILNRLHTL